MSTLDPLDDIRDEIINRTFRHSRVVNLPPIEEAVFKSKELPVDTSGIRPNDLSANGLLESALQHQIDLDVSKNDELKESREIYLNDEYALNLIKKLGF